MPDSICQLTRLRKAVSSIVSSWRNGVTRAVPHPRSCIWLKITRTVKAAKSRYVTTSYPHAKEGSEISMKTAEHTVDAGDAEYLSFLLKLSASSTVLVEGLRKLFPYILKIKKTALAHQPLGGPHRTVRKPSPRLRIMT